MTFTIKLEPCGTEFTTAAGETILAAALRHNVELDHSCKSGVCGTCMVELLHGNITYPNGQPTALLGQTPTVCLVCQAVPQSNIACRTTLATRLDAPIVPREFICKIHNYQELSHDVVGLTLRLPGSERLNFLAGQYLEVILDHEQRRCFSIANPPHAASVRGEGLIELHIRRVPGGEFTGRILPNLKPGKSLLVNAPLGTFTLRNTLRPLLCVAGGTGFAPIKAIIEQALQENPHRTINLYWGVRARRDLYLSEVPQRWEQEYSNFKFIPVLSEPDADWQGRRGFVHQAMCTDHPDPSGMDAYVAGPPAMVEAARVGLLNSGLKPEHLFIDAFVYAVSVI